MHCVRLLGSGYFTSPRNTIRCAAVNAEVDARAAGYGAALALKLIAHAADQIGQPIAGLIQLLDLESIMLNDA